MIKLKNKKGSHVGMILSFTIFITAIIFAYSIIGSPFKIATTKTESIDLLKVDLLNELEREVIIARIYDTGNLCVQFSTPGNSFSNTKMISVQANGGEVNSVTSGDKTLVSGLLKFVKIYYADGGLNQTLKAPGLGCTDIEIKSVSREKIIMEQAIFDTINRVQNDYDNLTRDLGVSSDDEIRILFDFDGTIIGEFARSGLKTNIFARKYEISYLSKEGQMKTGGLIINLW